MARKWKSRPKMPLPALLAGSFLNFFLQLETASQPQHGCVWLPTFPHAAQKEIGGEAQNGNRY